MKWFAALSLNLAISVHAVPFGIFERVFSTPELNAVEGRQNAPSGSAVNQGTISLIESLEGFTTNFVNVNGHPTIGFGHDCTEQKDCGSIHAPLSKDQGTQLLQKDLPQFTSCVAKLPNCNKLNANQFGALTSFTFNSGCGNLAKFFNGAMQQGNPSAACNALPNTNTLGGELSSRRQKEAAFCNSPTNEPANCNGTASTGSGGTGTSSAAAGQASNKAGAGGGKGGKQSGSKGGKGGGGGGKGSKSQAAASAAAATTGAGGSAATSAAAAESDPAAASDTGAAASDAGAEPTAAASADPAAVSDDPAAASGEPAAASDAGNSDPPAATPGPVRIRRAEPYLPRWV